MFSTYLPPVVFRRAYVIFTLFVFVYAQCCPTHIVLCFGFVFLRLVYSILPVSLDCPFLTATSVCVNVNYILYMSPSPAPVLLQHRTSSGFHITLLFYIKLHKYDPDLCFGVWSSPSQVLNKGKYRLANTTLQRDNTEVFTNTTVQRDKTEVSKNTTVPRDKTEVSKNTTVQKDKTEVSKQLPRWW